MIAGNHDYIKKNSYYRTFSWASHVHMICSQEIDCVELDRIQTAVYGCSYYSREIHDPVYDHAVPEGRHKYEQASLFTYFRPTSTACCSKVGAYRCNS